MEAESKQNQCHQGQLSQRERLLAPVFLLVAFCSQLTTYGIRQSRKASVWITARYTDLDANDLM